MSGLSLMDCFCQSMACIACNRQGCSHCPCCNVSMTRRPLPQCGPSRLHESKHCHWGTLRKIYCIYSQYDILRLVEYFDGGEAVNAAAESTLFWRLARNPTQWTLNST
eukprot:GHRR01008678.1.p1 GENE.GHRR01008678.1~~GHRR01008678.1.p1  ORF type:complete len:108 (+),score=6.84 GHRR01008678.1:707-1030(+)